MSNEPNSPFGFTVTATKSDGRTWLNIKRHDGVSASLSCQTSHDSGETIVSQVVTEFAAALSAPAQRVEEGRELTDYEAALLDRAWRRTRVMDDDPFEGPRFVETGEAKRLKLRAASPAPQRVEEGWRPVMQELVDAMRRYEVDVEADAPQKHRDMMDRADRLIAASPAPAPHEDEKWRSAFAAQSRKLQAVLHIPGVKEALADLDHTAPAPHAGVDADVPDYDAGLLNDFGGGDVSWWQDYLRAEIERANQHWRAALGDRT